jgi:hypothetical protein
MRSISIDELAGLEALLNCVNWFIRIDFHKDGACGGEKDTF